MMEKLDLLCLGEVLMRLSPLENERLLQAKQLVRQVGGAELNVAAAASMYGLKTGLISKLPAHAVGRYAGSAVRSMGVSDQFVIYDETRDARLGLYYYENGAHPRKPGVVYDRRNSSAAGMQIGEFPEEMYGSARCFHTSGITLALCREARETGMEMIRRFKKAGALISFDVNFRGNLWSGPEAKACITEILPYVDIFFCSESTARLTFGKEGDVREILKSFAQEYPISVVAATMRTVHSPKCHSFGSLVYDREKDCFYEEKPYENIEVVDRIGSGDAYVAGALYGLLCEGGNTQKAMAYGNASGAVKNTIPGDLMYADRGDLEQVMAVHQGTGGDLEMAR